jgi:DNA invertase Pin-like site-specific DNA recombinase
MSASASVDTVGYRRVSTQEQAADWKTSLDDQTRSITECASRLGRVLTPEMIFEDRFSGEHAEQRHGFMALIEFCRARPRPRSRPGYAIFLNDSRFGRFPDPDEAAAWRFELARAGWIVRFVENDDTEDLTARHVMRSVGSAQASEYLANLKKNAKRGARGAAARGLWQNEAPFGYRRLATSPGREPVVLDIGQRKAKDQQVQLTPHPEEADLVRWMFETYAAGEVSFRDLSQTLRAKAPRLKWSRHYVRQVLARRTYLGEVVWCRRPHDKEERREIGLRPESEWVVTPNAHPALVSQQFFDQVQARLAKNQRPLRATQGGYPLSGLIRCAVCGSYYVSGGGRRGPEEDLDRFRFYRCAAATSAEPACPGKIGTLSRRWVESLVIGEIARAVEDPQVQLLIEEEVDRVIAELHANPDGDRIRLERERQSLETEKVNLVRAIARGALTDGDAAATMERIRSRLEEIGGQLMCLRSVSDITREIRAEGERLRALARDFGARARELSGPQLRELIVPWLEDATYDKRTRTLHFTIRRTPQIPSFNSSPEATWHTGGIQHTRQIPVIQRDPTSGRWLQLPLPEFSQ